MRFNPDAPKVSVFSPTGLIAWLITKPRAATYNYTTTCACMLAEYFTDAGFKDVFMTGDSFGHRDGYQPLPPHFDDIAKAHPHTYGAALDRTCKYTI